MLGWLAHTTVAATALAIIVALACRAGRFNPAVRHALWLVVLLKLLMPPIYSWPVPFWPKWERVLGAHVPTPRQSPERQRPRNQSMVQSAQASATSAPSLDPRRYDTAAPAHLYPKENESKASLERSAVVSIWRELTWADWLLILWLVGSAFVLLVHGLRVRRFRRLLMWRQAAPPRLLDQIRMLAARLRVRAPGAFLVPGITTPFLWCLGRPRLLLPEKLLDRFAPDASHGVLLHELAHLKRKDHWVAWLQAVAACLWWWNPLFWLVRARLRENAELACDAWVIHTIPDGRRAYAEALLEVCRRMAPLAAPTPALGMGSRGRRALEGRLTMIMQDRGRCRVPLFGLAAIGLLALAILPGWSSDEKPAAPQAVLTPAKESDLLAALQKARVNGKYEMLLRQIYVPDDVDNYTAFNDFGLYQGTSYAGHNDLPPGYWVYVEPYWYIWRDLSATPKMKRAWGPEQATGAPDTEGAGDIQTAWASLTPDGQDEWLMLEYTDAVVPKEIHVYETYNPGALYKVTAFRLDGTEVEVWKGKDPTPVGSDRGISKIPVKVDFKTNRVKIYLASKDVPGWNEIDAVGLVDTAGKTQWARSADASSTFAQPAFANSGLIRSSVQGKRPWGPEQLLGPPDTPEAGDYGTAWASLTPDGQDEWVQTEYAEEVSPREIHVYETFNPGALYKVSVFKLDGTEVEVWKGKDPTPIGSGKGVSIIPIRVNFTTKRVKIYLASKDVPGWNEIDAIGLKDAKGRMHWAVGATASSSYAEMTPAVQDPVLIMQQQLAAQMQRLAALEKENRELKTTIKKLRDLLNQGTDDQTFIRRAYLDVTGTLPSPQEIDAFVKDSKADKRQKLIDDLTTNKKPAKKKDK